MSAKSYIKWATCSLWIIAMSPMFQCLNVSHATETPKVKQKITFSGTVAGSLHVTATISEGYMHYAMLQTGLGYFVHKEVIPVYAGEMTAVAINEIELEATVTPDFAFARRTK